MVVKVRLVTAQNEYERLHQLTEGTRASVVVPRELLLKLLMDHSCMAAVIQGSSSFSLIIARPRTRLEEG